MLESTNQKSKSKIVLSIHVHVNGLSFFTHHPASHKANPVYRNVFSKPVPIERLHEKIYAELKAQNHLGNTYKEVRCCVENNLATLVPKSLFEEAALHEYIQQDIDVLPNDFITYDKLPEVDWVTVYVPFVNVNNMLLDTFGSFRYFHAVSVWLSALSKHSAADGELVWGMYKENNHIHVSLFRDKKLQFYNCFEGSKPEDITYYVLLSAKAHDFSPNEVPLFVVGGVVLNDPTYKELNRFVRSINFLSAENTLVFETPQLTTHQDFCLLNLY